MVAKRWAMHSLRKYRYSVPEDSLLYGSTYKVTLLNSLRIVFWIMESVSGSTELVASSSINTLRCFTRARQSANSWRSPPLSKPSIQYHSQLQAYRTTHEKLFPSSVTCASNLNLPNRSRSPPPTETRPHRRKASFNSTSVLSPEGSRFCRIVPLKRRGSWGIADNPWRSVSSPTFAMFTSSTVMTPPDNSTSLNKACKHELLPAPVLPTMPICH